METLVASHRGVYTFVVFTRVTRVGTGVKIPRAYIYCPVGAGHRKSFAEIEKLALGVGFETCFHAGDAAFTFDIYKPRCKFAILYRCDAADYLYPLDVVRSY